MSWGPTRGQTSDVWMCASVRLQRYNRQNKLQEEAWIKNNHLFREHFRLKSEDTTAYAREESTWAFGSQFTQWLQDEEGDDEEEDPNASGPPSTAAQAGVSGMRSGGSGEGGGCSSPQIRGGAGSGKGALMTKPT